MESGNHTYAGSVRAQSVRIHFSSELPREMPRHNVSAQRAMESNLPLNREEALQKRIGELAAQLEVKTQEHAELQQQIAAREGAQQPEGLSIVSPWVVETATASIANDESVGATTSTPITHEQARHKDEEELTPAQQRYEKTILYLLDQPDQIIRHENAGRYVRDALGFSLNEWGNISTLLGTGSTRTYGKGLEILRLHKKTETARRSYAVSLSIEALLTHVDKPFVTQRVLEKLREGNIGKGDVDRTNGLSVAPNEPGDKSAEPESEAVLTDGKVVQLHTPRPPQAPPLSKRVARALERDPEPVPGYRREPEGDAFLAHRRVRPGTRR